MFLSSFRASSYTLQIQKLFKGQIKEKSMIFSVKDYLIILISLVLPSPLKIQFYKVVLGYKIQKGCKLGLFSAIVGKQVYLGKHTAIDHFTIIKCRRLKLGDYTSIGMFNLIYGYYDLIIGRYCYIGEKVTINLDDNVFMGNHTAIGPRCSLYTHGVWLPYTEGHPRKFAPIKIGNQVRIICNNIIQPGVTIGDGSMIAPNSVVVKDIPAGEFVSGVPAKKVKDMEDMVIKLDQKEVKERMKEMISSFRNIFSIKEDVVVFPDKGKTKKNIVLFYSLKKELGSRIKNKNIAWFDFEKRICKVNTEEEKIFRTYIWEKYGEWFIDVR